MDDDAAPGPSSARLDELLLIANELRRLGVAALVDERVPPDPRSRVTHGQCIEALIATILLGTHTLYSIGEVLEPYDLELTFGWPGATADHFHDVRVSAAMDALFDAGIVPVSSAALVRAVQVHELDLGRLHLDTTSVAVYGQYSLSEEPAHPDDPQAIPHVTRGHSKDKRGDLKQIVYGVSVTADSAVPTFGRAASGNRADVQETRFLLQQLSEVLPEPRGTTLVGDSKFFSGETLVLAQRYGMHVVTMLPRGTLLWGQVFTAYREALGRGESVTTFKATYPPADPDTPSAEAPEPTKEWVGRSFDMPYTWDDEEGGGKQEIPLRLIVVESSTLRAQRSASIEGRRAKERAKLEQAKERTEKREFKCETDAGRAAEAFRARHGPDLHGIATRVVSEEREAKRAAPGRPRADEVRPRELVWRVKVDIDDDQEFVEEAIFCESCYVLVSTLPRTGEHAATDQEVFDYYREQNSVEGAFRWAKNPLAVAPIFLKTSERIAALGLVYVLALMTYALIQRHARARLEEAGEVVPGNRGVTSRPTTEVLFRLFRGIDVVRGVPGEPATVSRITQSQLDALEILEHPLLKDARVRFNAPRASGRPRDRAYENWRSKNRQSPGENGNSASAIP